jgi:hypothetical protein
MRKLFGLATLLIAFFLVACEADPAFTGDGAAPPPATGPGGPVGVSIAMGSGSGASFQSGVIAVSQASLQAGGSTSLTVNFVDTLNNNAPAVGADITVNFASTCTPLLASIVESSITTTTGTATATYSATGCSGDDTITATSLVDDVVLTASGTVNVAAATVGSIQFVSADPINIGLKGTGGAGRQETSTVRFRVTDSTNGPVSGATVDFALSPPPQLPLTIDDITLTPPQAQSDAQGFVQTVVSAGSVATVVRVTATVIPSTPAIAAQSDQLTITTGIPDNDSVSLSIGCVNIEGWDLDGVTTEVTVRMSDRYNNPVPDDTAVTLTAEGGQIGGSCLTATTPADGAGVCSVTFVSQDPRDNPTIATGDGRVSILATAIGEESFIDQDGDGIFNNLDMPLEIGEPFRDDNENLAPDPALGEVFSDFNTNGVPDAFGDPDYVNFNGLLCDGATATCGILSTLFVSDSGILVMSSSAATITDNVGGLLDLTGGTASVTLTVGDAKGNGSQVQPMAGGTIIDATTSNGSIAGPDNYVVPCSNANMPLDYVFTVEPDTDPDGGVLSFEVTSPSGLVTTHSITVID